MKTTMALIPTKCPNCNSNQKFAPRRKNVSEDLFDVYIRCNICGIEKHLYRSTNYIERLKRRLSLARASNNVNLQHKLENAIIQECLLYGIEPNE